MLMDNWEPGDYGSKQPILREQPERVVYKAVIPWQPVNHWYTYFSSLVSHSIHILYMEQSIQLLQLIARQNWLAAARGVVHWLELASSSHFVYTSD